MEGGGGGRIWEGGEVKVRVGEWKEVVRAGCMMDRGKKGV